MTPMSIAGVVLIVLGETVIDIGPVHATADRTRTLPLPPVVGIAAVAGGVALLVVGMRKHA